jgi:hypothetical protein
MKAKRKKAKKTKAKREPSKVVQLTMDRAMKEKLEAIANDAYTDIPTVAQVLLATGMHMGRNGQDAALRDAMANITALNAMLGRCRNVMEANDPGNAREIFGEPLPSPAPAANPEEATVP